MLVEPPWARVVETCHSLIVAGATGPDDQDPTPASKSAERPVLIPIVSVNVSVPDEVPSFQPRVKVTACGTGGDGTTVNTKGVAVATVAPEAAAGALEAPSTIAMLPSEVLKVNVSAADAVPALWSVTRSVSLSPPSGMPLPFPDPPSRIVVLLTRRSGPSETERSKDAVSALSCAPTILVILIPVSAPA